MTSASLAPLRGSRPGTGAQGVRRRTGAPAGRSGEAPSRGAGASCGVLDRPAQTLLDEAAGAALLVVGRHGRARGGEALLGSVSHAVLHYARCPVAVVGKK
ncbi:universal stress protein [Pseudonocardia bannensis]|uniref:universal stress protein n=1 Tax=Pseudonocardia bannensis TaxID=630973 RepID=UPI001FE76E31|nr:universal stress protein [Pseudonocardia bannensis]